VEVIGNRPPDIENISVSPSTVELNSGVGVRVQADISDDISVSTAEISYRRGGERQFMALPVNAYFCNFRFE